LIFAFSTRFESKKGSKFSALPAFFRLEADNFRLEARLGGIFRLGDFTKKG